MNRGLNMRCRRLHAEDLLNAAAAAKRAGVEVDTWHSYVARGLAPEPVYRLGSTSAWTADVIDAWMRQRPGQGVGGGPKPKKRR